MLNDVREQQDEKHRHIDISQPRDGSLAKAYIDEAERRREARAQPTRYVYAPGITRSITFGNKKLCFLMSKPNSPTIGFGFFVQQIKCGRNLRVNPLSSVIPDKS